MKRISLIVILSLFFNLSISNASETKDASECKINYLNVDKSFLNPKGTVRGILISVDFKNNRAQVPTKENALEYISNTEKFYSENSFGKLNLSIDYLDKWISLPENTRFYAKQEFDPEEMISYAELIISKADPLVDFSKYEIMYIVVEESVKEFFSTGPVIAYAENSQFKSDEGIIKNIAVGTSPYMGMGGSRWRWLSHETGHMFGLGHPHSYENDDNKLASIFSLMDFGWVAPGFYSFERWMMGWIDDSQIICIDYTAGKTYHTINSIYGEDEPNKAGVIKISEDELIFFESRRSEGLDRMPKKYEGLFVYHFKDGIVTPILANKYTIDRSMPSHNGDRVVGTIRGKRSVTYKNITITNLRMSPKSDYVEVLIK